MRSLLHSILVVVAVASTACGGGGVTPSAHTSVSPNALFQGVLTWHNDAARTGQNRDEIRLTPSNVSSHSFGKRFARRVDGMIYAQPLYVPHVSVPGAGIVNVVVVASETLS